MNIALVDALAKSQQILTINIDEAAIHWAGTNYGTMQINNMKLAPWASICIALIRLLLTLNELDKLAQTHLSGCYRFIQKT